MAAPPLLVGAVKLTDTLALPAVAVPIPGAPGTVAGVTLLVAPDGALNRLPLGALPGSKPGSYLIEELSVAVIPVPQVLPELLAAGPAGKDKSSAASLLEPTMLMIPVAVLSSAPAVTVVGAVSS